jgi:DNA polymerase epsilon subunit 2
MLAQRYALTHQRILRHKLFRPNDLHNHGGSWNDQLRLTRVESLLGTKRDDSGSVLLLGILIQMEEGQYYLEDPTGQIAVSFLHMQDAATTTEGFFVTEYCILMVEGTVQDDILYVQRLGHPLLETRETSMRAIQQQVSHPSFQLSSSKPRRGGPTTRNDSSFVILSDVHLDRPRVLQQLEGLLASYENDYCTRPSLLPLFVFMGNFTSQLQNGGISSSSSSFLSVTEALEQELLPLLGKFPTLAQHAHVCLVPGPQDTSARTLPLPAVRLSRRPSPIRHLHLATNPCRITWAGHEMVVFRYDLLQVLQQRHIRMRTTTAWQPQSMAVDGDCDDNDDDTKRNEDDMAEKNRLRQPHCRLVKTILDQGHLMPVAGVPIYWNHDQALRLYPLPDVLVLGGDSSSSQQHQQQFHEVYGGCHVIHPGSMATRSSYAVYEPHAVEIKRKDDDGSDDDSNDNDDSMPLNNNSRVAFYQVGDEMTK